MRIKETCLRLEILLYLPFPLFLSDDTSRKVMVELVVQRNPKDLEKWNRMWEEMKDGSLHPRELKEFYDSLMAKKNARGQKPK